MKKKLLSCFSVGVFVFSYSLNVFAIGSDAENIKLLENAAYSRGDVNCDGIVDIEDATSILSVYACKAACLDVSFTSSAMEAADVNGDSEIDLSDAALVLEYYARSAAGFNPTWSDLGVNDSSECHSAIEYIDYTMEEFRSAFPDAVYDVDVEGGGPGYYSASSQIMKYEDGIIKAYAGKVTQDIEIGMSYSDVVNKMGEPAEIGVDGWSMSEYMVYYIDGCRVALCTFKGSCKVSDPEWSVERASILKQSVKDVMYECPQTTYCYNNSGNSVYCELAATYFYDVDWDGEKETIARYEKTGEYDTFYRVYESNGSYLTYQPEGIGATGYTLNALVYDKNIDEYYMAEIYYHGSNSGCGIEIHEPDNWNQSYAVYHIYTTWKNGRLQLDSEEYSIDGMTVSEYEAREYMQNIEIIDIEGDNSKEFIRDKIDYVRECRQEYN